MLGPQLVEVLVFGGELGGMALLEDVCRWGWAFGFQKPMLCLVSFLCILVASQDVRPQLSSNTVLACLHHALSGHETAS